MQVPKWHNIGDCSHRPRAAAEQVSHMPAAMREVGDLGTVDGPAIREKLSPGLCKLAAGLNTMLGRLSAGGLVQVASDVIMPREG